MTTTPVTAVQDQEDCTESGDFDVAAFSTIATGSCLVQPAATADPALNPLSTPNQEGPPNLADSCVLLPSSYWLRSYQNLEVNPTLLSLSFFAQFQLPISNRVTSTLTSLNLRSANHRHQKTHNDLSTHSWRQWRGAKFGAKTSLHF